MDWQALATFWLLFYSTAFILQILIWFYLDMLSTEEHLPAVLQNLCMATLTLENFKDSTLGFCMIAVLLLWRPHFTIKLSLMLKPRGDVCLSCVNYISPSEEETKYRVPQQEGVCSNTFCCLLLEVGLKCKNCFNLHILIPPPKSPNVLPLLAQAWEMEICN